MDELKISEVAAKIYAHLKRMEKDPEINQRKDRRWLYQPNCYARGSRVFVNYISYQHASSLQKWEAEKYLEWLDAGNVGEHWKALESWNWEAKSLPVRKDKENGTTGK